MMQTIVTQFPWLNLSTLALLIFFTFFIVLVVITGLNSQRAIQNEASLVPLNDETEVRRG